jgi:hypothetical protein
VARARVAPGPYRAIVSQAELRPSEPRPGALPPGGGWYGERRIGVGPEAGQRFELELLPGVRVAGVQVDAEGRPVAQRIAFTPPELARLGARGLWLYADFPRPDGSFSIGGVPPGAELVDDRGGGTHVIPGGGLSGIVIRQQP